nr:U-box domain-containing protein 11-like [Tanacetum cinerariifolium]
MQTPPMARDEENSNAMITEIQSFLCDVSKSSGIGFTGVFKKDCIDLSRRVALLYYLLEEIKDFESSLCSLSELMEAIKSVKGLIVCAGSFDHNMSSDGAAQKIALQFQLVTWKLEKALANLPYDQFDISEEVKEQVDLVRGQLKRVTGRYCGPQDLTSLSCGVSVPLGNESDSTERIDSDHQEVESKVEVIVNEALSNDMVDQVERSRIESATASSDVSGLSKPTGAGWGDDTANNIENKKVGSPVIPDDFLCPISLELMKDPVIVSTGQTYERLYIQRWINCGNITCPKTRVKLQNTTLTPNYVLRSLITQWCTTHKVDHPTLLANRRLKKSDGTLLDVSQDIDLIEEIVHNLSSHSIEEQRTAASKIRSLSKRSTDNRILIAEAGAIPILVDLLTSEDTITLQHVVTSILNLSLYKNNKELIMLANAVPSLVQVLITGTMETRENTAATLFSLSLEDENKIIIGASGAIPHLVDLLRNGSKTGKDDAAKALFNLCIYQGNKGKAVRAGIIFVLIKMLTESNGLMVDVALTILAILASHQDAKAAMVRACVIPNLVDHLTSGNSGNKENATSILLSLCKRDNDNLGFISRLGAMIPLTEIAENGTERAQQKANSLLAYLQRFQDSQQPPPEQVD